MYIETYGCQMNVSDSEIVQSVLAGAGYTAAASAEEADIMLLNTCAIRERAEQRIWSRLGVLRHGYAQVHILCILRLSNPHIVHLQAGNHALNPNPASPLLLLLLLLSHRLLTGGCHAGGKSAAGKEGDCGGAGLHG